MNEELKERARLRAERDKYRELLEDVSEWYKAQGWFRWFERWIDRVEQALEE